MARIRSVKPEFWGDEKLAPLDPIDRLVFLGLVSMADDCGRVVDSVRSIDGFVFPMTEHTARESLVTLANLGRIMRGVTDSGQRIIEIVNWRRHQKIDRPNFAAALPPLQGTKDRRRVGERSTKARRKLDDVSSSRSTIYDLRSTTNDLAPADAVVEPVEQVTRHYLARHPRRRIGPKDRKAVAAALALGYTAAELCTAIDGNAVDPWHVEKRKHELPYVLRDNGKIDDFRARAEATEEPLVDEFGAPTQRGLQLLGGGR